MEGGYLWIGNGLKNFNMECEELEGPEDCDKAYQCIRWGRLQFDCTAFIDTFTGGQSTSLTSRLAVRFGSHVLGRGCKGMAAELAPCWKWYDSKIGCL